MLGDSININNLCCNSAVLKKKLAKPLKNCFLGPICTKKGLLWATLTIINFFLTEITKADHQLSENFYFIKLSYVLNELWIFFYREWCSLSEKYHFQLKQLCWNSTCVLQKIKFDSLVHLILKCPLGYMTIDHIALTTTRKVSILLFALLMMIVLCLANCKFYTLDWYEGVLASISAFWGDSGMNSESKFNIYLCPWKVFRLKTVEALLFLLRFLPLVFHFNLILVNILLLLCSIVY